MRVAADTELLEVAPGATTAVVLDVVNNGAVIDGVSARVIGLPEECVKAQPALLPLFPDASGQMTLSLAVPLTEPAGHHPLTIELISHGARAPSQFVDVDLDVGAHPAFSLTARPRVLRSRRSGRFILELANEGNVPLEVNLRAADADRATTCRFTPELLRLEAGAASAVLLTMRGPRMLTGSELDRTVTVEAAARRLDLPMDTVAPEDALLLRDTTVRLRQRPLVSRGVLTALILAGIVALWAGVFLLGLTKVFSTDPMTKEAPASFFAASSVDGLTGTGQSPAPAGSLPKTGQVPAGVGGEITGTVSAVSNRQPVGRILVQAVRISPSGPKVVSSAATLADGSYTIAGLFPTEYYLKFSASGFNTVWYPTAKTASTSSAPPATAAAVPAFAQGSTNQVSVVIAGKPASISGTVDAGDTLKPVIATVTARSLIGGTGQVVSSTRTTATGEYTLRDLPAPGTYQLTFTAASYQATTLVDSISGGDARLEPTVLLGASAGAISGTVTDGLNPVGGATVTTTVAGKALVVMTPTTGQVGVFILGNLPTPGTYVITFTAPGHGSQTKIVDLGAGESRGDVSATLLRGTGSVTGRVVDRNGNGLGGVKITVGGAATDATTLPPSTTTLTAGAVGSFAINGLVAPGSYTLTAALDGYAPATVPFTLDANTAPPDVRITLTTQLGTISGRVSGACPQPYCAGAVVTATDGAQTWTATVSGPGGALPNGGYLITGLLPGTYSVTVTLTGMQQQTAMVVVVAGTTTHQDLGLGG